MLAQPDHQCSPLAPHPGLGEGPDTSPRARVPPALLTCEDGVCGVEAVVVQNSPCFLHPLQKTSPMRCLPLTQLIRAKGWGETFRHNPLCLLGWPRGP